LIFGFIDQEVNAARKAVPKSVLHPTL